jgi:hypothetical protein
MLVGDMGVAAVRVPVHLREALDGLAENPALPPELRERLAHDPDAHIRLAIFARPDTPERGRRSTPTSRATGSWS